MSLQIISLLTHMDLHDWLNLLVRWAHVITGIMWIGSSFYFVWLDANMEVPKNPRKGVEGELWMCHSGGFYNVEKRLIEPGDVPENLHWFKWEATFTWVTGFMLLWIVYYTTGGIYLVDPSIAKITPNEGTLIGLGLLVFSWFFYDFLFRSKLANSNAANVVQVCSRPPLVAGFGGGRPRASTRRRKCVARRCLVQCCWMARWRGARRRVT